MRKKGIGKTAATVGIVLIFVFGAFVTLFSSISKDGIVQAHPDNPPTFYQSCGYWYRKPSTYAQLISWYQNLEQNHTNYMQVWKANEMYGLGTIPSGNYYMYYVRITNESRGFHKPEVLFEADIHGDEKIGAYGAYWFADWLIRHAFHPDYASPESEWLRWLIDNREIYIVPSANPDGFDENHRGDNSGNDMNRQFDHSQSNPWGSINTQIMRRFIDNHTIRVAVDLHAGYRGIPYPWSNANYRNDMTEQSAISGRLYEGQVPADFRFFDAAYLRLGTYIGNPSGQGAFTSSNIGPWTHTLGYDADGTSCDWWYGGNVLRTPAEDPYVRDETYGNYPGCGIMSTLVEYGPKDITESQLGNDTVSKFGAEIRRTLLHQTDLAQPYLCWQAGTVQDGSAVDLGESLNFTWQVNGSLVVDDTYIQYGMHPDPVHFPQYATAGHQENGGSWYGGTGWDTAVNGNASGVTYSEIVPINTPGDYYFVAKAKVDQVYKNVILTDEYGNKSYLRIIQERTNASYHEALNGTDGLEVIDGSLWWYSPVIHVRVGAFVNQKMITINHTKVLTNCTDFPLLINLNSDNELSGGAQEDGDDIRFIASNGNQLDHEIEFFNKSTGRLIAWVRIPHLSNTVDTVLYMQYGNASSPNQQNPAGVWGSEYRGVWHFPGDLLDSTSFNNDGTNHGSTNNTGWIGMARYFDGNDYVTAPSHYFGANHSWSASLWFKSNSSSSMQYHYLLSSGGYRVADAANIWYNNNYTASLPLKEVRVILSDHENDYAELMQYNGSAAKDTWHCVYATWNHLTNNLSLYVNGSLVNCTIKPLVSSGVGTANLLHFGARTDLESHRFHVGSIDEVRFYSLVRNASWIATEYNNQYSPQTFYTIGYQLVAQPPVIHNQYPVNAATRIPRNPVLSISVLDRQGDLMNITFKTNASTGVWHTIGSYTEVGNGTYTQSETPFDSYNTTYYWSVNITDGDVWTNRTSRFTTEPAPPQWWNSGWLYRKIITLDHTRVDGELVNYPVLISLPSDKDLAAHAQDDGDDILFTDYNFNSNKLHHEIEVFNHSTGQLVAWVNVTQLSKTEDTLLVLYYGNPGCGSQQDPEGVWDANYKAIWHLKEDPGAIGVGGIKDSTRYHNNGTSFGSMDTADHVSGRIGYGIDFDGANDVIRIDNSNGVGHSLDFTNGPFTLEAWFNSPLDSNQGTLISKRDGDTLDQYQIFVQPNVQFRAAGEYGGIPDSISQNTWYYTAALVNSTNYTQIFLNTGIKSWSDLIGTQPYNIIHRNVNVSLGARYQVYPTTGYRFTGILDEVRISNIMRSSAWLSTTYKNCNDPQHFYRIGIPQSVTGAPTLYNETPQSGSAGVGLNPVLSIEAYDWQSDAMTIVFRTNATGFWQTIGTNSSVRNGLYSQGPTTMHQYLTSYWWSVNATDAGSRNWTNYTYCFTTKKNAPLVTNPSPANGATDVGANPLISVNVLDYEGDPMTVLFRSNRTGTWQTLALYSNVSSGTVSYQTRNMTALNMTYWWCVNVTDSGSGHWENLTCTFRVTSKLLKVKWSKSNLYRPNAGGDLLADVTGDGIDDIIHAGTGGVNVLDGRDGHIIWSRSDGGITPDVRPEMIDLDNDGILEVLVPLDHGALALHGNNGTTYWRVNNLRGSAVFSSPIAYDIEGYGYPYVYIPVQDIDDPLDGTLNMLTHDGHFLRSTFVYRPCWGGMSIADCNYDGIFELYMGDRNTEAGKGLRSFWASNLTCRWNYTSFFCSSPIPMIADANKDGILDIVICHQSGSFGITVRNYLGGNIRTSTGIVIPGHYQPAIYDIDRDGNLEIAMANPYGYCTSDVVVWDIYTGTGGWKEDARFYAGTCEFGPKFADVTGDGVMEMIVVTHSSIQIYNKTFVKIYEVNGLTGRLQFAVANDVDGDGLTEVVVPSTAGIVYVLDTIAPVPNPRPRSEVHFYSEYRLGAAEYVERPGPKYPMRRDIYPANGSTLVPYSPTLSAYVWDYQWDEFNITFKTNASGTWQTIATYNNIGRYPNQTTTGNGWGTYTAPTTGMNTPFKKYYWRLSAVDKKGNVKEATYSFTTADIVPVVSSQTPTNRTTGVPLSLSELRFAIMDCQGDRMNYTVVTSPPIGSGSGTRVVNGTYSVPVSGLELNTTYHWYLNVTDGTNWNRKVYTFTTRPNPGAWWNNNWLYRKEIIINNTRVAGNLVNFPVLINLPSDSDLALYAQDSGNDLVFTTYSRQKLNHQIELFNGSTGQLVAWVNVTRLNSSGTLILYLYFGNPAAANQQNPLAVWESRYLMVHHMNETSGILQDSTINNIDGTPYGAMVQNADGKIDGGDLFDRVNDYIDLGTTTLFNQKNLAFSAWVKTSLSASDMRILLGNSAYTNKWFLHMDDGYFMVNNNTIANANLRTTSMYNDNQWHYIVGNRNPLRLYVDGQQPSAMPRNEQYTLSGNTKIGARTSTTYFFGGSLDEIRIFKGTLSSEWILTEYNNQNNPSMFYTVGERHIDAPVLQEASPTNGAIKVDLNPTLTIRSTDLQNELLQVYFRSNATGSWATIGSNLSVKSSIFRQTPTIMSLYNTTYWWSVNSTDGRLWTNATYHFTTRKEPGLWWDANWSFRKKIVIDYHQVAANLSNFPVLISLPSDSKLALYAQDDGDDFVFTDEIAVRLNHEIEFFNGLTGQLVAWVNVTELSKTRNTTLYLYYGNATCTSQQNPERVWEANYTAVWHLTENPGVAGASGIKDSSKYHNHGTDQGAMNAADHVAGKIGYGLDFDSSNDSIRIDASNLSGHSLDFTSGPFTIEAWMKSDAFSTTKGTIVSKRDENNDQYHFYLDSNRRMLLRAGGEVGGCADQLATATWYYGVIVVDAAESSTVYRDGVLRAWTDYTGARPLVFTHRNVNVTLGARLSNGAVSTPFDGILDEIRVSNIDRSAAWLATVYANGNSPSTFYRVGPQQTRQNQPPVLSLELPVNGSTNVSVSQPTVSVFIEDPDEDRFAWMIHGPFLTTASQSNDRDGTKSTILTTPLPYNTEIVWYVNVTDTGSHNWTNATYHFTTRSQYIPTIPSSFSATTQSRYQIALSWTKGGKADRTVIERSLTAPWNRGEGTLVYNNTGTSFLDAGLNENTHYYYQAWSWNNTDHTYSATYAADDATTLANQPPIFSGEQPTNGSTRVSLSQSTVSVVILDLEGDPITWTIHGPYVVTTGQANETNGTKFASLTTPLPAGTTIYWYVNATVFGSGKWTNRTYHFTTIHEPAAWWNDTWSYRREIVIDHSQVAATLMNFPVLINIPSDSSLAAYAQDDGDDLVFISYDGTKLHHEIELFNGSTGQLVAWVNITSLSSSLDTVLYLYYKNPTVANQQNPAGAWSKDYHGVWHLNDNFLDSTMYNNDGTNYGSNDTTGWIGDARSFDGNDYITAPSHCLGANHSWSASCWFQSTSPSTMLFHYFLSTGGYDAANAVNIWQSITQAPIGETRAQIVDSTGHKVDMFQYGGANYLDNQWHLISVTWDVTTHTLTLYIDGDLEHQMTNTNVDTGGGTTNPLHIGARTDHTADRFHLGRIDEVRISNPVKTPEWIQTEFNNQNNSGDFYDLGYAEYRNSRPLFSNVDPSDNAGNIALSYPAVSVYIEDPEGSALDWTIQGYYLVNASGEDQTNGTKLASLRTPLPYGTNVIWYVNATDGLMWTRAVYNFTTHARYVPDPPIGFSATAMSRSRIDLAWTKAAKADTTYIERNLIASWNRGEGTLLYNNTGATYPDTGLLQNTHYYYQAWSWNETDHAFSTTAAAADATTFANTPPLAAFTFEPSSPIILGTIFFNSTSYDTDGTLVNWSWDFDDGNHSYGEQVTHHYVTSQSYSVELTVLDNDGAIDSIEQVVVVSLPPPYSWNVRLNIHETSGLSDTVIFGENTYALDGRDSYDIPKPGASPEPYVYAWFDAGLSEPYNRLLQDYRSYPDTATIWNLSLRWVPLDYVSPTTVTISWNTIQLTGSEYSSVILRDETTATQVDMKNTSLYTFTAAALVTRQFKVIGGMVGERPIASLEENWNLVSLPFNLSVAKTSLRIRYNGTEYSWGAAVSQGVILNFFYEWVRETQSYDIQDTLSPGSGYWMWAYHDCDVSILLNETPPEDVLITLLQTTWNIIGLPNDSPCEKENLVIRYEGIDYNWTKATTNQNPTGGPIILGFLYDWNRGNQLYQLADALTPGSGCWMYAYYDCVLKRE